MTTHVKTEELTIQQIESYVGSEYPLVYLYTSEEQKTLDMIKCVAIEMDKGLIFTFDAAAGLQCWYGANEEQVAKHRDEIKLKPRSDIKRASDYITNHLLDCAAFVVLLDPHHLFQDSGAIRIVKNLINKISQEELNITIFAISPVLIIPAEIEKETVLIDIPWPTKQEISEILDAIVIKRGTNPLPPLRNKFVEALSGLTAAEVKHLILYCLSTDNNKNILVEHDVGELTPSV